MSHEIWRETNHSRSQQIAETSRSQLVARYPYYSAITSRTATIQPARRTVFSGRIHSHSNLFGQNLFDSTNSRAISSSDVSFKTFNSTTLQRERERQDLIELNNKFAQYIEKVRFLEAQNRKLEHEIYSLRNRLSNTKSHMKEMFDIEIEEAEKLRNLTGQGIKEARDKRQRNEHDYQSLLTHYEHLKNAQKADQNEIQKLQNEIAENEANISIIRRRLGDIEDEARLFKAENQRMSSDIALLQQDIQAESIQRSNAEMEKRHLENVLVEIQQIHESELTEIRARNVSIDLDQSNGFKNQLVASIQKNRAEYEKSLEEYRQALELKYNILYQQQWTSLVGISVPSPRDDSGITRKITEDLSRIRDENEWRRTEISSVTRKLNDLKIQLDEMRNRKNHSAFEHRMATLRQKKLALERQFEELSKVKIGLHDEIAEYRTLLEGKNGLRSMTERIYSTSVVPLTSRQSRIVDSRVESNVVHRTNLSRDDSDSESKNSISAETNQVKRSSSYQRFSVNSRRSETEENLSHYPARGTTNEVYVRRENSSSPYESRRSILKNQSSMERSSISSNTGGYVTATESFEYQKSKN